MSQKNKAVSSKSLTSQPDAASEKAQVQEDGSSDLSVQDDNDREDQIAQRDQHPVSDKDEDDHQVTDANDDIGITAGLPLAPPIAPDSAHSQDTDLSAEIKTERIVFSCRPEVMKVEPLFGVRPRPEKQKRDDPE